MSSLERLIAYLRRVQSLAAALLGFLPRLIARVGPDLIPPWPDGIVGAASLVCVFVVLGLFFGLRTRNKRIKRLWGLVLFWAALGAAAMYLVCSALLVVNLGEGDTVHRVVRGFCLRPDATAAIEDGVAGTPVALMEDFGWESPHLVWYYVGLPRALLALLFVVPFAAGAGSICALARPDLKRPIVSRASNQVAGAS